MAEVNGRTPDEEETVGKAAAEEEEFLPYPMPFMKVLFSFQGRINRKVFWLRGVLPVVVLSIVVQSVIGGLAVFVVGISLFGAGGVFSRGADLPAPAVSQFRQAGKNIFGVVRANAGRARVNVEIMAGEATSRIDKTVIVGGHRLRVTAARKPESIAYDTDIRWENYPGAMPAGAGGGKPSKLMNLLITGLSFAVTVFFAWPMFAIAAKRYHDRDRSGWWSLVGLIPLIGSIWLFVVLGCLKGTSGENRFGPDPLEAESVG